MSPRTVEAAIEHLAALFMDGDIGDEVWPEDVTEWDALISDLECHLNGAAYDCWLEWSKRKKAEFREKATRRLHTHDFCADGHCVICDAICCQYCNGFGKRIDRDGRMTGEVCRPCSGEGVNAAKEDGAIAPRNLF